MFSQICSSQKDIDDLLTKLKISPCPHCKVVGALIKHGFLRGYDHNNQLNKSIRAARVCFSNRYRAAGCGRTFSVWTADKIKHFFLSAHSLWQFLNEAATSGSKLGAFRKRDGLVDSEVGSHHWAGYDPFSRFIFARVTCGNCNQLAQLWSHAFVSQNRK